MIRILAGTINLVSDYLGEVTGSFGRFILRREAEDPFLIIRERGLSLGTSARTTGTVGGSGRSRLSERRLGVINDMPRSRIRVLIFIVRVERRIKGVCRTGRVINTRGLLRRRNRVRNVRRGCGGRIGRDGRGDA